MKLNLSWTCWLFKRHSPARHNIWLVCCKCAYRQKPEFLCRFCTKNRIPIQVRKLSKAIKPYWFTGFRPGIRAIDEMHNHRDDAIYDALITGASRKEKT